MKIKFTDPNENIYSLGYSSVRPAPRGLEEVRKGPDGREYRLQGVADKTYTLKRRMLFAIRFCASIVFSCGFGLRREEVREDLKAFWSGKRVKAVYVRSEAAKKSAKRPKQTHAASQIPSSFKQKSIKKKHKQRVSKDSKKRLDKESQSQKIGSSSAEKIADKKEFDPQSINLSYKKFSEYYREAFSGSPIIKINGRSYETVSGGAQWIQFEDQSKLNNGGTVKVHLSVKRTPENMEKAFDIVLPILMKYQIRLFKIAPLDFAHEKYKLDNAVGKEFVIYIQAHDKESHESNPETWEKAILKEIVEEFHRNNVLPGPASKGDCALKGGSPYAFMRVTDNFVGEYVAVDVLEQSGFTSGDAAHLSDSPWMNLNIATTVASSSSSSPSQKLILESLPIKEGEISHFIRNHAQEITDLTKVLLNAFKSDLNKKQSSSPSRCPLLFSILSTDGVGNYIRSESWSYLRAIFNVTANLGSDKKAHFGKSQVKEEFFKEQLESVARFAAIAISFYRERFQGENYELPEGYLKSDQSPCGNILPAIYAFLRQYHLQGRDAAELLTQPFMTTEEEQLFMKEILKCALREPVSQIRSETPIYQFGLSEEQVEGLVTAVMQNG